MWPTWPPGVRVLSGLRGASWAQASLDLYELRSEVGGGTAECARRDQSCGSECAGACIACGLYSSEAALRANAGDATAGAQRPYRLPDRVIRRAKCGTRCVCGLCAAGLANSGTADLVVCSFSPRAATPGPLR